MKTVATGRPVAPTRTYRTDVEARSTLPAMDQESTAPLRERPFEPVLVRLPGHPPVYGITVASTMAIWREMTADGLYARGARRLRPGDRVLDIGANIGLASIFFHSVQPKISVIAVEPAPDPFTCLQLNLAAQMPDAVALRLAVAADTGSRDFVYYPNAPGNSGLYTDREADDAITRRYLVNSGLDAEWIEEIMDDLHSGVELTVATTTVSELLRAHPCDEVGLLKIDVERAEWAVLQGIEAQDWPRIRAIVAEVHDEDGRLDAIRDLLNEHGMQVRASTDEALTGTGLIDVEAWR